MTSLSKTLLTLALVLPVMMFAGQAKAEITGDQIKAVVSGKTLAFTGEYDGTIDFNTDGSAVMTLPTGDKKKGKWWVNGNQFCSEWGGLGEHCGPWKDDGGKYLTTNGFTMIPQ